MGLFGKYLIRVNCDNGTWGYYMDTYEGYINLTKNTESAERFLTQNGARGFASGMDWTLPVFGDEISYVESIDLIALK